MRSSSIAAVGVLSLSGVRIATAAPPAPLAGDPVTAIDDPAAVHAVIAGASGSRTARRGCSRVSWSR